MFILLVLILSPFIFMVIFQIASYLVVAFRNLFTYKKRKKEENEKESEFLAQVTAAKDGFNKELSILIKKVKSTIASGEQREQSGVFVCKNEKVLLYSLLQDHNAKISDDGLVYTEGDSTKYGSGCTAFFNVHPRTYHLSDCPRRGRFQAHILEAKGKLLPCKICNPNRIDTEWMETCKSLYTTISVQTKLLDQALCIVNSDINRERLFNLIAIKERTNKWLYNSEVKEKGNPPKNKYFKAIARIFASKIKVHILDTRLPLKNHGWHVDCKNMTFGKYIYTETWITYGIKSKKIIWKKRDPKTKELYALIQKKDNGASYVSVVKKIDWLSEIHVFFG